MVVVRFITSGASSVVGGFERGDLARVSEAFARHLVEEIQVAQYVAPPVKPPEVQKVTRRRKSS